MEKISNFKPMAKVKKYASLLFLLMSLVFAQFVATKLMIEDTNWVYCYIPQESDFVIEINTRNFINELAYQRIYNEKYFMNRNYEEDEDPEPKFIENGIDPFGKIIIFREQWASESIWFSIIKYTNEDELRRFVKERIPSSSLVFDSDYAIVQLTNSKEQDKIDEHLEKIRTKAIKPFTERVNLMEVFDPTKEINAYIFPKNTEYNGLLDGHLSFDFLKDRILIDGSFSPVSGYELKDPIAYAIDEEAGMSLRSSLNVLNRFYWFNEEKIENLPDYRQMAFDYYGIECQLIHRNQGFSTPFMSYPDLRLNIDINDHDVWQGFLDTLQAHGQIQMDTINPNQFNTAEGAHFEYAITNQQFQLRQDSFALVNAEPSNVYFELQLMPEVMLDGTIFSVHETHPPSQLEQSMGLVVANSILEQIRDFSNMEKITFQLTADNAAQIFAHGEIDMKEKEGHSMVESLTFGTGTILFLSGLQ